MKTWEWWTAYAISYVMCYYLYRGIDREPNEEETWEDIRLRAMVSALSLIALVPFLIFYAREKIKEKRRSKGIRKTKPPKWL